IYLSIYLLIYLSICLSVYLSIWLPYVSFFFFFPVSRLTLFFTFSVSGFGIDPSLRIDVFEDLNIEESYAGVSQVQGFHNESTAFLFKDMWRSVRASAGVSERMLQKLRGRVEFTLLLTLKQDKFNSGVMLSIHHGEQRYLELESSGQRSEVRLHYWTAERRTHSEVFPYSLADGRWHRVALSLSASQLVLYVDCSRIYERLVETPSMDVPAGTTVWLGQRNNAHGFFKVSSDPLGDFLSISACPTCNDFHGLVQKIMELQDILAKTSGKLARAEERMRALDGCYCERTCSLNGEIYRDEEVWIDGCKNCTIRNCCVLRNWSCSHFLSVQDGTALKKRKVLSHPFMYVCGQNRSMRRVESTSCPELTCPESEQITLTDRCCKVCRGHDFCAEGYSSSCVENSECVNLEAGACCSCRDGYRALRDDSAYCQDVDECAEGKHYCRENTVCVNTPGSFMCVCQTGYIRIDDYSCTEHDECISGLHRCDENALCFNMVGGHSCTCKPGYVGNGTVCRAQCDGLCHNGGSCVAPDTCICQQGFTGRRCETDIDECSDGFVECDSRATCVNLPGWYHCECRDGYHDNGMFSANGESCEDIDECETGRHNCANDTVCFNMDGGYDCRCPHGKNCTGDCVHEGKVKHNRQIWVLDDDRCSVCSCQTGLVMCRRMVCDCENPTVDVSCCPECDPRLTSQCLHQNGLLTYNNGDTWVENCQQCQCMRGEVDCWPVPCAAVLDCEFLVVPEGECCPHCVSDPCQADTVRNDITKTCVDEYGITRFSGSAWTKHGTECSLCQCKVTRQSSDASVNDIFECSGLGSNSPR
uniref:Neural EGFL like 2 n=1 Tax=Pygocentrus nattereri TaxID=42514 RepID=A0AAR2JSW5_PYGNA